MLNELLTQYNKDETVTHLVDSLEIYVVPVFNVDGYAYTYDINIPYITMQSLFCHLLHFPLPSVYHAGGRCVNISLHLPIPHVLSSFRPAGPRIACGGRLAATPGMSASVLIQIAIGTFSKRELVLE